MANETNGNGNGNSLSNLVAIGALILGAIALIFGFILILIVWGGVDSKDVLPWTLGITGAAMAFLYTQIKSNQTSRDLKAQRVHLENIAKTVETVKATSEEVAVKVEKVAVAVPELQVQLDGVMHELNKAQVGQAIAETTLDVQKEEGEKAADLAVVTADALAEAQAAPSNVVGAEPSEVVDVNVVTPVVTVDVVEKGKK